MLESFSSDIIGIIGGITSTNGDKMYLSRLKITNFRNYRFSTFDFKNGVNTIIGENDSGKSNALTALRILLDDRFYYSPKNLKDSDFNRSFDSWKGHWIIITAEFEGMTPEESRREAIASFSQKVDVEESLENLNFQMSSISTDIGSVSVIIRPNDKKRKELFAASGNKDKFNSIRQSISLVDYEFLYRSKSIVNFSDENIYNKIVGDLENYDAPDPDEKQNKDDVIGIKLDIKDITNLISVIFIDALRDVLLLMSKGNNPIKTIVQTIESHISEDNILEVHEKIRELNSSISGITELRNVQGELNNKLVDILGLVYSPELSLSSNISDELTSLSKFLNLNPENEEGLNSLGLGHLNMIFIALKIVEYNISSSREVLNIMLVEEPEAHIHHHIQKTLFRNLGIHDDSTQVIMTTHSPNIAEVSEISRMNIVKGSNNISSVMKPFCGLNQFGTEQLNLKLDLTSAIERYLDTKRSALLFSKGVMLVEGDAEEIIIPTLVKKVLGISLDEIGVSLINIGSTSFEYIAPLFSEERIQRYCAVITDLDKQAVPEDSVLYKKNAEDNGKSRKEKLERLFENNLWVHTFLADTTFEIEFSNCETNITLYKEAVSELYVNQASIDNWKGELSQEVCDKRNEVVLKLADKFGKGWLSLIVSKIIFSTNDRVCIPSYIIDALLFASQESLSPKIIANMINGVVESEPVLNIEDFIGTDSKYKNTHPSMFEFVKKWKDRYEK